MSGSNWSQEDFDKAAEEAKSLPDSTTNDDKLILYGLFKQANVGDCDTSECSARLHAVSVVWCAVASATLRQCHACLRSAAVVWCTVERLWKAMSCESLC